MLTSSFVVRLCFLTFGLLISNVSSAPDSSELSWISHLRDLVGDDDLNIEIVPSTADQSLKAREKEPLNHNHDHEESDEDEEDQDSASTPRVLEVDKSSSENKAQPKPVQTSMSPKAPSSDEANEHNGSPLFSLLHYLEHIRSNHGETDPDEESIGVTVNFDDLLEKLDSKDLAELTQPPNEEITQKPVEIDAEKRIEIEEPKLPVPTRFPRIGAPRVSSTEEPKILYPARFPRIGAPRVSSTQEPKILVPARFPRIGAPRISSTEEPTIQIHRFPKTLFNQKFLFKNFLRASPLNRISKRKPVQIIIVKEKENKVLPSEMYKDRQIHLACFYLLVCLTMFAVCAGIMKLFTLLFNNSNNLLCHDHEHEIQQISTSKLFLYIQDLYKKETEKKKKALEKENPTTEKGNEELSKV